MTPKQALDRIRAAGPCFVIFDANTGEVLEVQAKGAADRPETLIGTMGSAANAHGPVKGRFFESCVTLEMLEHEVEESLRVAGRVAIFSRWALLPAEELVHVLETDDFAPPMDTFHGPNVVIDRLFDYAPDVLAPLVPRLEDVAQHRGFEASVRRKLESKLAVLAGDFSRLKALWERFDRKIFATLVWHPDLLDDIGALRPRDPEPIEILIQTVSYPKAMMFGPRFAAMKALGKVGAPAGPRAARGIRDHIYDSSPAIVTLREHVLSRIDLPESAWTGCSNCYWGRVPGRPWQGLEAGDCAACLGLGFVRS